MVRYAKLGRNEPGFGLSKIKMKHFPNWPYNQVLQQYNKTVYKLFSAEPDFSLKELRMLHTDANRSIKNTECKSHD